MKTFDINSQRFRWSLQMNFAGGFQNQILSVPLQSIPVNLLVSSKGNCLPIILFDAVFAWNSFMRI